MLSGFVTCAGPALAQDTRALRPPIAQGSTEVAYPAGGTGAATVLLELLVEQDGSVSQVEVLEGAEPFAEQARRAVLSWRFVAAQHGDAAVRARIRARIEFQEPAPVLPSAVAPPPSVPEPEAAPESVQEVTVRGQRHELGQTTLSASDVRELPGAFGDPFRAIEVLPSVMPVVSGFPYFYIRGAPPNDNGYFIDGIRVPLLFHVGIGQGVLHPGLMDRVDLYPGAAPASYGGFAGAIVAGQTREPATVFHGEANLRLLDAGALLEAPLGDGRGSVLVAGRYGYPGPILSAVTPDVKLGYWDYQARATWRIGPRDTLGLFAFGSHDYFATVQQGRTRVALDSNFHRLDLRYDRELDDGQLRLAATLGHDVQGGSGGNDDAQRNTVSDRSAALRVELEGRLAPTLRARAGAAAQLDAYGFEQGAAVLGLDGSPRPQVPATAAPPPTNLRGGAHADVVWRPTPRVEVVPGVRVDVFASSRANPSAGAARAHTSVPAFDPRLSARLLLTDDLAWLSALGLSHQYPTLRAGAIPAPLVSVPGFPFGDKQLQTAVQGSQGLELALPADVVLSASGFLSVWRGLTDLTADCMQIMPAIEPPPAMSPDQPSPGPMQHPYVCPSNAPVSGRAFGLELLVRRPLSRRLSGWLSYTLARSVRQTHFVTADGGDQVATVASEFDRSHVLNVVLAYDLGRRWRAGARSVFYTGAPYSKLAGNVPVPPYNSQRFPAFFRLDARIEKRWALGQDGFLAFVIEGQNVTLSKEVIGLGLECQGEFGPDGGTTQCTPAKIGPITIPSLGLEASF